MRDRLHIRRIAIGAGFGAALLSAGALAAETAPPAPSAKATKITETRLLAAPKRSIAAVSQQPSDRASCEGAWCGRQVVLILGIGF